MKSRLLGSIFGHCVGDALGLPVEYRSRMYLRENPVSEMHGFGTHNQPAGTWSDDTSLMLCTVESLCEGIDIEDMARRLVSWYVDGTWTPWGAVFDVDGVTKISLELLKKGIVGPTGSGVSREEAIGNGALSRIVPLVWQPIFGSTEDLFVKASAVTAITHAHGRAALGSTIYLLLGRHLVRGYSVSEAYRRTCHIAKHNLKDAPDFEQFGRIISGELLTLDDDAIVGSNTCVGTLESAIWCLIHYDSFSESVLAAVNLGGDTDSVGAITGALAGMCYGAAAIPGEWIRVLPRKKEIMKLALRYLRIVSGVSQA